MFNKKHDEQLEQQKAENRIKLERLLDFEIEKADAVEDPVKRIIALQKVELERMKVYLAEREEVSKQIPRFSTRKQREAARAKLEAPLASHYAKLMIMKTRIDILVTQTVNAHVTEISKSPVYKELLSIPGMSRKFSAAAAKHIIDTKKAAEENNAEVPGAAKSKVSLKIIK